MKFHANAAARAKAWREARKEELLRLRSQNLALRQENDRLARAGKQAKAPNTPR
jgi:hypothetical protein